MIRRCWQEPNFKCEVVDRDGQVETFLCRAGSAKELEDRLKERRLDVRSIVSYNFSQWRKRARDARRKAIRDHRAGKRPIKFNEGLWRELKLHLFDQFNGKCAYCEWKPLPGSRGDVEHYRPKHKVDKDPNHPGYYWLAYSPSNLLPSCQLCNEERGKMTRFPVQGFRATKPSELKHEEPLLLNPYDTRPDYEPLLHLAFNEFGGVTGTTPVGNESQTIYHLNRGALVEDRLAALKRVEQDWDVATLRTGFATSFMQLRSELRLGEREYSAAQLSQLYRLKEQRVKFLESTDK